MKQHAQIDSTMCRLALVGSNRLGVGLALAMTLLMSVGCDRAEQRQAEPAAVVASEPAAEVALIPRAAVFGNPDRTQARISPDGKTLSWLAPKEGVLNVFVAPVHAPDQARAITGDTERGIRQHYWSRSGSHILYLQDQGGNENYHVYAARVSDGEVRDLTPVKEGVRAVVYKMSLNHPNVVLIGLNDRDPELFDPYRVDIVTGERTLVLENPGYSDLIFDNELRLRFGVEELDAGGAALQRFDGEGWEAFETIPAEDVLTTEILGFDQSNEHFYAVDSRERDTAGLTQTNVTSGERRVLAVHAKADISNVLIHPATHEVLAYAANYLRNRWTALNADTASDLKKLSAALEGDLHIVSMTNDGQTLLLSADSSTEPSAYYRFDRPTGAVKQLFVTRPALSDAPLQTMHPRELRSRDGLSLVSYLTLPPNSDPDGDGVPINSLPMVLYVHGGPWARDEYGYNTVHQWLANRGYAVLSVNYRGSTGFGKAFTNAAVKQFAGKMHDDLIDAVQWAVTSKIAKSDQVAIMGGSYGGYATLVGLTFTPDTFACGVDIVGPSSLITLVESFPAYWGPSLANTWYKYVGNPADESERADLANRSPINRVADIRSPLLIGQGQNDPRVTKLESDQLVAAMAKKDLPVTYLNYPDEGHGFARPENRMSFFATTEGFLSQCLGGRYEPIGKDFDGSSVEVLHGADYVPGLKAVITTD